jgi:hypothetical protein
MHLTDSLKHRLVSKLIGEAHTRQRTDSWIHILVSDLIPYTRQPRPRTDTMNNRLVTELIRCTTQPRERTESLKHRLVSELIR